MRTSYIVGAGSSACVGAPLLSNFKEAANRISTTAPFPRTTMRIGFSEALAQWDRLGSSANIEDFYTHAELQSRLQVPGRDRLADDVRYLIAKTLAHSIDVNRLAFHERFVNRVGEGDAILSLNWDIAVELAALPGRPTPRTLAYGYQNSAPFPDSTELQRGKKLNLLKLHGSHNWWICESCRHLWYSTSIDDAVAMWDNWNSKFCPKCGVAAPLSHLVLPPSPEKLRGDGTDSLIISEIWRAAREALQQAEAIAIVGYSFPRTDVQFRMFLLDAIADNPDLRAIDVVTEPKYGSARASFEDHYGEVFRGSRHFDKLGFHYQGFQQWV